MLSLRKEKIVVQIIAVANTHNLSSHDQAEILPTPDARADAQA